MKKPDIPKNENSRLAALHALNILDTASEERFDRITRTAVRMFSVETATITLVDSERQWFKSIEGEGCRCSSRQTSFCGHTILEDNMLIVEDATKDPRFKDNPYVLEEGLRFYAGVPLHTHSGEKVGSFCIRDTRPRRLNTSKRETLRDLGKWAELELNRGARESTLALSRIYWNQLHDAILKAPVPTILHAENEEVLLLSDTWREHSGYTLNEMPDLATWRSKSLDKRKEPEQGDPFPKDIYRQSKRRHTGQFTIRTKTGEPRIWDFYSAPLGKLPDGRRFAKTVAFDITEEKQREEELQRLYEEWTNMFDAIPDPVAIIDNNYQIIRANQALTRRLDADSTEIIGKKCYELMHDSGTPPQHCPHQCMQADGQHHVSEIESAPLGGTFLVSVAPTRDRRGEITGAIHIARDITRFKKAELEREEMAQFAEMNPQPVFQLDVSGKILRANQPARDLFTADSDDDSLQDKCPAFLDMKKIKHLINEGGVDQETIDLASDQHILFTYRGFPEKKIVNVYGTDITELKHTQEALKEAKNEAQAANQAKTEFLANMSHELRTPLNSVIGFADLLKEKTFGDLNEKQTKQVTNISKSARHLLDLLNDVLDLSKIEADKMTLEYKDIEIKPFIGNTVDMLQQKAVEHGLSMQINIADTVAGRSIRADERKLRQVMFNLLSNATKFTPDGGSITVTADLMKIESGEGSDESEMLCIAVTDTGIGITTHSQAHIFDRFSQLDAGNSRQYQGTGLGLALTKRLVELHDGWIFVESEGEGEGATFTFQIPMEPPEEKQDAAPDET